ncbi:DNA polymerase III subunit delta [Legionella impletisoli]|uniref:DNA polymerase III subunit delta n=1 Tax=Legionella impletisoli TaxID=343510 RepID=A0A917N8E5_9GAMM|nr:DNA polymerase III subunit delta [Legionella impletisoli]GGI76833.1 DNA polymerase III subunit delta [Legionella impletisoli]
MLIKYEALAANLKKSIKALYIITGQDPYLLNDAQHQIKLACRQQGEVDCKTVQLINSSDWTLLLDEANNYSLFADHVLINAYYDKKTIEKAGKEAILSYLKATNPRCQIILNAPNVPAKQLQWLSSEREALIVQIYSFSPKALQQWIASELKQHGFNFEQDIPSLIQQYTQGNMLACAQTIEKLALTLLPNQHLNIDEVKEHLFDQCDYQLYELADACLAAQPARAIHLLRQACESRKEPTLILWILVQEIRLLIQLSSLIQHSHPIHAACTQLKIWPQKRSQYEVALKRLPPSSLYRLLQSSHKIDQIIKAGKEGNVWHEFENLVMNMCH